MSSLLRQIRMCVVAGMAGFATWGAAWAALDVVGHDPGMASGLGAGVGVGAAALTGRWIQRRHVDRERLARLREDD